MSKRKTVKEWKEQISRLEKDLDDSLMLQYKIKRESVNKCFQGILTNWIEENEMMLKDVVSIFRSISEQIDDI